MLLLPASHPRTRAFHRGLKAARQFHRREGHLQVPAGHRENLHGDDVLLGRWIAKHRSGAAQLTSPQITALTALGIEPERTLHEAVLPAGAREEAGAWWATPEPSWAVPLRRFAG